ncbi:MAG: hypothetical protein PHI31_11600 [Desulfuromonadaceae bacterium]|nr:hypothetical protein [Desulfuromonadaceae bacterium]
MPNSDSMVAQAAFWVLKQFGGGAVSSSGGLVLGKVLEAIGTGGPNLNDIKSEIQKVQSSLTDVSQKLTSVSNQLDTLLVMAELSRTEILSRLEELKIWEPMQKINAAFDNLLEFNPAQAGTPHARNWACEMVEAIYKGKYDIDLQLRIIHNGIVDGILGGFLTGYTDHILAKLRNGKISLPVAYDALECLYGELLGCQLHGLLLYTEALNYRDAVEKDNEQPDNAAKPRTALNSAADYTAKVFKKHIEEQIALFLHCIDRLVLSQADLRIVLPNMPAFLPQESIEVYHRADLLARCVCPAVHGHEVVTRLIGDPTWIEGLVKYWALHGIEGEKSVTVSPGPFMPELIPLCNKSVTYVEQKDLNLPPAEFPTGEFLEFTQSGCRPQTRLAIAKFGRSSTEPRTFIHTEDGAIMSPEERLVFSTDFQWYDGSLKASSKKQPDSFLLVSNVAIVRSWPYPSSCCFNAECIKIVNGSAVKYNDNIGLLTTTMRPEMTGKCIGAKFVLTEHLLYEWSDNWYATAATDYTFKYAVANSDKTEWLSVNHPVEVKAWDTEMNRTIRSRQTHFVPATVEPEVKYAWGWSAEVMLKHVNTFDQCPWTKVRKRPMSSSIPNHPVLQHFSFQLDEINLTVIPAPAQSS